MNDRDKLIALLESFGLPKINKPDETGSVAPDWNQHGFFVDQGDVTLQEGQGYGGFYCEFTFDTNGKFVRHGVYE